MMQNKQITAELVRRSRLAKGYTQSELSELTNISLRSIQRIENGQVNARTYTLKILAGHLGFEIRDIGTRSVAETVVEAKEIRTNKIILSFGLALITRLLGGAFLSQSANFPETTFERLIYWALVTMIYLIALLRIWKK